MIVRKRQQQTHRQSSGGSTLAQALPSSSSRCGSKTQVYGKVRPLDSPLRDSAIDGFRAGDP